MNCADFHRNASAHASRRQRREPRPDIYLIEMANGGHAGGQPQWQALIATSFREIAIQEFQHLRRKLKPGEAVRAVASDGVVLEAGEASNF